MSGHRARFDGAHILFSSIVGKYCLKGAEEELCNALHPEPGHKLGGRWLRARKCSHGGRTSCELEIAGERRTWEWVGRSERAREDYERLDGASQFT